MIMIGELSLSHEFNLAVRGFQCERRNQGTRAIVQRYVSNACGLGDTKADNITEFPQQRKVTGSV
jgi:hypothetical protein